MGIFYTILLGLVAAWLIGRVLPGAAELPTGRLAAGGAIGAIALAWIAGSLSRQASFVMTAPGGITLAGAFVGGLVGAFAALVIFRSRVP